MTVYQLTADPDTTTPAAREALPEGALVSPDQFTCNVYLAVGERTTLVDAGTLPGIADTIREYTEDLDAVVLTHQHGDHIGQLDEVLAAFDPELVCYSSHPERAVELEDGDELTLGDDTYKAVYTPGHATDHVAFVGRTTLFSGDVVVPNDEAFEYGSFGRSPPGTNRERLIDSLQRLLSHVDETVEHLYAGHGDAFHGDVRDVIRTALEHAEARKPKYG